MSILLNRIRELERRLHAAQTQVNYWRQRAQTLRAARLCSGCECSWDEQTPGCRECTFRHSKRRTVAA